MIDDVDSNGFQNDELDRVIRAALAPISDPQGVERLERYWRRESRKDRWQRRAYFAMSAAAAAVILIGLLIVAKLGDKEATTASVRPEQVEGAVAVAEPSPGPSLEGRGDKAAHPSQHGSGVGKFAGRAPTEYERFMFIARTGKAASVIAEGQVNKADNEGILAEVGRTDNIEWLVRMARRTREARLQRAAMARLLEIESYESLLGFLALVRDGATRSAALAAADADSQLPLASMLVFLDHDDKAVRRSAAVVLGNVNGPEVTQALIARVTERPSGAKEAWMALMGCRGEAAEEFIAYAASRPQLLGHLNSARVQMVYGTP